MPHYDRHSSLHDSEVVEGESVFDDDRDAMEEAAQALREAEVEAVQPAVVRHVRPERPSLESMSIDELRALAAKLDVPDRGAITEQDKLIAAIRERM